MVGAHRDYRFSAPQLEQIYEVKYQCRAEGYLCTRREDNRKPANNGQRAKHYSRDAGHYPGTHSPAELRDVKRRRPVRGSEGGRHPAHINRSLSAQQYKDDPGDNVIDGGKQEGIYTF